LRILPVDITNCAQNIRAKQIGKGYKKNVFIYLMNLKVPYIRKYGLKQINDYLTSLNYTLDNVVNSEYIYIHNDLEPRTYF
jgi:hypothetical protein